MNLTRKIYNLKCKIRDIVIKQIENGNKPEIDTELLLQLRELFLKEKHDFFIEVYGENEGEIIFQMYTYKSNLINYLAYEIISAAEYSVEIGRKVCPKI